MNRQAYKKKFETINNEYSAGLISFAELKRRVQELNRDYLCDGEKNNIKTK